MHLVLNQELLEYTVEARNFADQSHNSLHREEVAKRFGDRGELVPGVGTYAYMTAPISEALREDWLKCGTMSAKFVKPVKTKQFANDLLARCGSTVGSVRQPFQETIHGILHRQGDPPFTVKSFDKLIQLEIQG